MISMSQMNKGIIDVELGFNNKAPSWFLLVTLTPIGCIREILGQLYESANLTIIHQMGVKNMGPQ